MNQQIVNLKNLYIMLLKSFHVKLHCNYNTRNIHTDIRFHLNLKSTRIFKFDLNFKLKKMSWLSFYIQSIHSKFR